MLDTLHVSSDKIVPGAAFYGKGWGDVDSTNFGLYQQGTSKTEGVHINFNNYTDFSDALKQGFEPHWDPIAMAGWFYNPKHKVFWTYDDIRSVALKARYVDAYNLRGLMFWDITGDDTMGNLVSTIYRRNVPDFIYFTNNKNNKPPEVKIIEPLGSDSILTRSNLVIQTIVSDDGYVAKVEFFIDGQSIGYNTISPFDWVWMNTTAGKHEIKAVATDNNGAQTTSLPIEINVIKN